VFFSCDAMLFDLDGVLVDSTASIHARWRRWSARHGLDAERVLAICHGAPTAQTIRRVAPHLDADAEAAKIVVWDIADSRGLQAYPGAMELLQSLPPDCWAIVTAGARELALARIRHTGLPQPAVLVAVEDVHHAKPDPEAFLLAASLLEVPVGRCLVVEDAPQMLPAVRAEGMMAIGVATTHPAAQLQQAQAIVAGVGELRVTIASGSDTPGTGKGPAGGRIQVRTP
jgi:sugar-phosphatase